MKTNTIYRQDLTRWPGNQLFLPLAPGLLETPEAYELEVAVPGLKKQNLKLEVHQGMLRVQGQRQEEVSSWFCPAAEIRNVQLYQSFNLPEDADADNIRAQCRDGLLRIRIPKVDRALRYRRIPIKVVGDGGEKTWWQKITRPLQDLKAKVGRLLSRAFAGGRPQQALTT